MTARVVRFVCASHDMSACACAVCGVQFLQTLRNTVAEFSRRASEAGHSGLLLADELAGIADVRFRRSVRRCGAEIDLPVTHCSSHPSKSITGVHEMQSLLTDDMTLCLDMGRWSPGVC